MGRRLLVGLALLASAAAQDIKINVTYVCNGERLVVTGCNIDSQADSAHCQVEYPDRPPRVTLAGKFPIYQSTTRGELRKLLPTCKQPSAAEVAAEQRGEEIVRQRQQQAVAEQEAYRREHQARAAAGDTTDPGTLAARRCAAAGRSLTECLGEAFSSGLHSITPGEKVQPAGLRLNGGFQGPGGFFVFLTPGTLYQAGSSNVRCGKLEGSAGGYSVALENGVIMVTVANAPAPVTFTLRPDGKLYGPATARMDGRVIVGSTPGGPVKKTESHMAGEVVMPGDVGKFNSSDLAQSSTGQYTLMNSVTTTSTVMAGPSPIYQAASQQCTIGALTATPGSGPSKAAPMAVAVGNLVGASSREVPSGLRLSGVFKSAQGNSLEFRPDLAVLECGEVQVSPPYVVEQEGAQLVARLVGGSQPVTFTYRSDGTLAGPAALRLTGRAVTGVSGGQPTFAPRTAMCSLGTMMPAAK